MCIRISSLDGINTRLVIIPYLGVRIRNMVRVDNFMQAASPIFSRRCLCATDMYIPRLNPVASLTRASSFITEEKVTNLFFALDCRRGFLVKW